ncbi:MAG: N-acetylmuramoyl-L-alanine amidase [Ruminococcus sp.]|nr:N-acetylmuramoyl-L-alanine amidase [Ruminococcus sp.]
MFFKNKAFIVYVILFIAYLTFIVLSFINIDSLADVNSSDISEPIIVIDAGHGGEDGGAVANNIVEKDINLSISKKLKDIFKASGFIVITTRDKDKMINTNGSSLRERKVSDMKNRLELFNKNENNIVVSIHQNKFSQEKYSGTQVFYSKNNPQSEIMAEYIRKNIAKLIQPENERAAKPADESIYLLYNSKVPAVIVECGFISNYTEANKLKDNNYQKKLAFAIYSGVLEFYNNR